MGFGLLKRPVYYQQVTIEPQCSCDKYCDVNELELMRKINNFTCTYYNLQKKNLDLIKVSKSKVNDILKYFQENIVNNKPAPVCCGDYCNKDELEFFKIINNHYNEYFKLTKEEKEKILDGANNLKNIYNYLKNKFDINPCIITSIAQINDLMRNEKINKGEYDNKFNLALELKIEKLGMFFDNSKKEKTFIYNGKKYEFDCD